jgi:hypothetical protein
MYETLVTGLRRTNDILMDASRRIAGETPATGPFTVDDYFIFELRASLDAPSADAFRTALETRRPVINIGFDEPDKNNISHTYIIVYPEDIHDNSDIIGPMVQGILPPDWPANEPFVYEMRNNRSACQEPATYHHIAEPFTDPRLSAVYDAVAAGL